MKFSNQILAITTGVTALLLTGCVSNQKITKKTTIADTPFVLTYQRSNCDETVSPTYEQLIQRGMLSQAPEHGKLSGGKAGIRRNSRSCGKDVPNREIIYTPKPGYVGKDTAVFWDRWIYEITVLPK